MGKEVIRAGSTEPAISRYLHQKGSKLGIPISGNFELTARCNFNCKMCYVHLQKGVQELMKRELTADQWLSLASDARDRGMLFLLLTGGEPLLRKDFPDIYRELAKMGLVLSINTNASLYNDEISELFREHPPMRVNVTLYGGSEETYRNLCGNASFEKVYQNLKRMKEEQQKLRLNVSLTPDNVQDLEKIAEISKELGLQAKCSAYMYPPVRVTGETGSNAGRFDAETAGRMMAKWSYLHDGEELFLQRAKGVPSFDEKELLYDPSSENCDGVLCRAGRSSFWMTWDGRMLPCGTMELEGEKSLELGFSEAWERLRQKTAKIRMPKECHTCLLKNHCGVCAANCKAETGEFSKRPEYLCEMAKSRCKAILELSERNGKWNLSDKENTLRRL